MKLVHDAPSFIGIAGIKTDVEAMYIRQLADSYNASSDRKIALGVLASYRGLAFNQITDSRQYPEFGDAAIFERSSSGCLNIVHYNSNASRLDSQIIELYSAIPFIDAVQLNISWPSVSDLISIRSDIFLPVILQIGRRAFRQAGSNASGLIRRLQNYMYQPANRTEAVSLIEYVLIDLSGGTGLEFDDESIRMILRELVKSGLPMRWCIAGGLGSRNIEAKIAPLLEIYPELSWDAQSSLRIEDRTGLDFGYCKEFIDASIRVLT